MFQSSLDRLRQEQSELQSQIDTRARELAAQSPYADFAKELHPLTTKLVSIQLRIRNKTPWPELIARREQLRQLLSRMPAERSIARFQAEAEFSSLDFYLQTSRRKPMTKWDWLILSAVVGLVFLSRWIVDWLAP